MQKFVTVSRIFSRSSSNFTRPNSLVNLIAGKLSTPIIHEGNKFQGELPSEIRALTTKSILGPAVTVLIPKNDNKWIHKVLADARIQQGDVLVVGQLGDPEDTKNCGLFDDIMTNQALLKKLGGVVIDGYVRESGNIEQLGLPLFARGNTLKGSTQRKEGGDMAIPIKIGDTIISTGDFVFADSHGVVIVSESKVEQVIKAAKDAEKSKNDIIRKIYAGETTYKLCGFSEKK